YDARGLVECRGLDGGDLVLSECLADDLEAAGERSVAEGPICLACPHALDCRRQRLLGIDQFGLRFRKCRSQRGDRFTGALHGPPPCRAPRSSPRPPSSAWPAPHARSPPWHPLAPELLARSWPSHGRGRPRACCGTRPRTPPRSWRSSCPRYGSP